MQPRLVREQLPGEEPALAGCVNVVMGLQLLLKVPDGVSHAGAEAQIFACGESYLQGTGSVNINICIYLNKYVNHEILVPIILGIWLK